MKDKKSKMIMWDVLSGDFDKIITKEQCLGIVIKHAKNGSIIVFHDSEKAFSKSYNCKLYQKCLEYL